MMKTVLQDILYSLRQWRESPGFVATAVLTLALGIGGATAIFTLIDAVMFRLLPVHDPGRLYRIGEGTSLCCVIGGAQERWQIFSFPLYERLTAAAPEFEEMAAFQAAPRVMGVRREGVESAARPLSLELVTGNYFSTLGVRAFGGRMLTPDDDRPAAPPVAVLSHHAWQTAYGADPAVLGSTFVIDGHPFTIIAVAPPGFFGETLRADPPDLWIPMQQAPLLTGDTDLLNQSFSSWLWIIGRLRPGASPAGIAARLTGTLRQWLQYDSGYPAAAMPGLIRTIPSQVVNVVPAGAGVADMKERYGVNLQILLAVCGLVLLIACANVANLLLSRAAARRGQTALRLAVGATRRRIVGQAITESVLLAVAGGIAGLVVAVAAARLMLAIAFRSAHFLPIGIVPSLPALAFAFGLALVTGTVSGAAPAWFGTHTDPAQSLRTSGRPAGYRSSFTGKALLAIQATLSVVLVASAAMLVRSVNKLERQDFGYPLQGRILAGLNIPSDYRLPRLIALCRQIEDRLKSLPGVRRAGLALYNPLTDTWTSPVYVAGHPVPDVLSPTVGWEKVSARWDRVSNNYLQDLGMTILRGRGFDTDDSEVSEPVAVVDEAFVEKFFKPGENPLDQHFGFNWPQTSGVFRIVGVVRSTKFVPWDLHGPAPAMFFLSLGQIVDYQVDMTNTLELRTHFPSGIMLVTDLSPAALEPLLTKALAEVDPGLTLTSVRTMGQQVELSFDQDRAVASLASLFGTVALLLAAVGLYAVTAYSVAQRTAEIGVRMALGATRAKVVRNVLGGALRRVTIGLLLGLPLAAVGGHLIKAGLYGVTGWDPLALTVATFALAFSTFLAAIVPASRAAAIEPMQALRME
jgi:predicted permease